jgi:hypothetical protein
MMFVESEHLRTLEAVYMSSAGMTLLEIHRPKYGSLYQTLLSWHRSMVGHCFESTCGVAL